MKSLTRFSVYILILIAASSCMLTKKQADENVIITPLSDTVKLREGSIVYGLPRSVFNIVVEMRRTIEFPENEDNCSFEML